LTSRTSPPTGRTRAFVEIVNAERYLRLDLWTGAGGLMSYSADLYAVARDWTKVQ
jgi:hypothetical protein